MANKPEETNDPQGSEIKTSGGPFSIVFPPEMTIWNEARKLIADKNSRVEALAVCVLQDPVIAMDLIRVSNAMYFSGGKAPITTLKTAIVRLGADVVQENLENLKTRPQINDEELSHWFELHRARCKRVAIVSKVIAEAVARTLSDDCETAALFSSVGEMLAVVYLKEEYVKLAEEHSRSGVNYRLAQDHKFEVERMGLNYLRRQGVPEALLFAIDRDGRSRTPDRAIMKPICTAAAEMVEAFDSNRWEKLAPGKSLPPKSAVRMLGIADSQYLKIYERASEYLFGSRQLEEKKKQEALKATAAQQPNTAEESELQSEIDDLLDAGEESESVKPQATPSVAAPQAPSKAPANVSEAVAERNELFGLKKRAATESSAPRVNNPTPTPAKAPQMRTAAGNKMMSAVTNIIETAKTSEELLQSLMLMLVDDGPFEKSALIVVSKDRKKAIVVAARGPSIGNGQKLDLDDPLSPLAQCFSKVQSFGNKPNASSPWGSKAFALAPIDADHGTPVALYADCGDQGALSFEARRVFRNVVDILNQKLPEIPGGIPVEI